MTILKYLLDQKFKYIFKYIYNIKMIVCLIIIIIILLVLLIIWWAYRRNSNCNNSELLNIQLKQPNILIKQNYMQSPPRHMGSIDDAIDEINASILNTPYNPSAAIENGHRELKKNENNNAPVGNVANSTDTSAPYAPPIPIYTESNIDSMDYDERNSVQSLNRNDPIRPIIGIMGRETFVDPYLREELDTTALKEWWGNGEY